MTGLELILSEGFSHRLLLPVIELAIRMGGKHQSLALTWINTSHLGPEILNQLSAILVGKEGKRRLNELLWIQRRLPSSKRALEDGRKGKIPNPSDAAALIRQLQGDQAVELTREILETPQAHLFEIILHPLCNLSLEAAATVVDLTQSSNPEVASRAKSVLSWPDVIWPEPEKPPELPNTFTPLGKGI